MNVSDLMTTPAHTCHVEESLASAARLMWENDFGFVPVLDGDGRVVGTVTDRDVCMAAYTQGRSLGDIGVQACMAGQVVTCKRDDSLEAALETMAQARVRRLPVVDGEGRLAGMLSMADVARSIAEASGSTPEVARQLLRALVAISTPHGRDAGEPVVELEPTPGKAAKPESGGASKTRAAKKTSTRKRTGR